MILALPGRGPTLFVLAEPCLDPDPCLAPQIEAVENHMPEILIVDEIGTEAEALACRTIAERGVVLIGTAHGCFLENLIKNPTLSGGCCLCAALLLWGRRMHACLLKAGAACAPKRGRAV